MSFCERLAEAMALRSLTATDLARQLGVDRSQVSQWACGFRTPNADNIVKLASALGVSSDWLLGLTDEVDHAELLWVYGSLNKNYRILIIAIAKLFAYRQDVEE